jgi:hypothetical protein
MQNVTTEDPKYRMSRLRTQNTECHDWGPKIQNVTTGDPKYRMSRLGTQNTECHD